MTRISIAVNQKTANRLKRFGIMGSTYDSILNEMMDHVNICDVWWNRE